MKVVAFLQNAWSLDYVGRRWPRRSWLRALHESRSGQRLRTLAAHAVNVQIWWDNTTPEVGGDPDSRLPPDPRHIRRVLARQRPAAVLALGRQAAAVLPHVTTPLLIAPHPAYRAVTNELYERAGGMLRGLRGVVELRQLRGRIEVIQTCSTSQPASSVMAIAS